MPAHAESGGDNGVFVRASSGGQGVGGRGGGSVVVKAYSRRDVTVLYNPRSIGKVEQGCVTLTNSVCGTWVYNLTGKGTVPVGIAATLKVSAALGGSASELFVFQNPFLFPLRLQVALKDPTNSSDIRDGISVLLQHAVVDVAAESALEIPILFTPTRLQRHSTILVLKTPDATSHLQERVHPIFKSSPYTDPRLMPLSKANP